MPIREHFARNQYQCGAENWADIHVMHVRRICFKPAAYGGVGHCHLASYPA